MGKHKKKKLVATSEQLGKVHVIDGSNYGDAHLAMKDILFMYHEHITSYASPLDQCSFMIDVDTGQFDPFVYIQCEEEVGVSWGCDIRLLQEGSIVALISEIINDMSVSIEISPMLKNVGRVLSGGGVDHCPLGKAALGALLSGRGEEDPTLHAAFQGLVVGYFRSMITQGWKAS